MKNYTIACILFILIDTPFYSQNKEISRDLNVLIVTGGHRFEREAFFDMFNDCVDIRWTEASHPDVLELFGKPEMNQYDAIVFYDMPARIDPAPEQKKAVIDIFQKGKAAVFLHHSLLSYQEWDEFIDILGGRYFHEKERMAPDGSIMISGYQHDVNYIIEIADTMHPVTSGLSHFEIVDEVYNNYYVKPDILPLLITSHPSSDSIIGWSNSYYNSRIVYLMNGHDHHAFDNENYRKLLLNAIRWTAEVVAATLK